MGHVERQSCCVDQQDSCEAACLCVVEAEDAPCVQDETLHEAGSESVYIDNRGMSLNQELFAWAPAFPAFGKP